MATETATTDPSIPPLIPIFDPTKPQPESKSLQAVIKHLGLQEHIEGGYFVETDRDPLTIPSPFDHKHGDTRNASTTIFYLITPKSPLGAFHRNRGRTVHTLHKGRGRYVLIHTEEVAAESCPGGYGGEDVAEEKRWTSKARVETFVVGHDVLKGERLQWIVEGGQYKSSFLLPDEGGGVSSEGLLISETVVPGFDYVDHDFMRPERLKALVTQKQVDEMWWMLRKE